MAHVPAPTETIHWSQDFDGDGVVFVGEIITYPIAPAPYLRLTFNSGNHSTRVELNPEDLGNFADLIAKAQKQAIAALVSKGRRA